MSVPLTSFADDQPIWAGQSLRLPAVWPYESKVDFLLVELHRDSLTLIVTTGRKAGRVVLHLPAESRQESRRAISAGWLKANWATWIYPECSAEDVTVGSYTITGAVFDGDLKME